MLVVRDVFHAKFGKANPVVAYFKEGLKKASEMMGEEMANRVRILTDRTGRFDTVVVEVTVESLTELEQLRGQMQGMQASSDSPIFDLVEMGHREIYNIE